MGRSASHIGLECALQTQPNICIISEEVEAKKQTLADVVNNIAETVAARAAKDMNFGVVLIPEGLIEFIPEMKVLISELNDLLAHESDVATALKGLTKESAAVYNSLPDSIAKQLTLDRDPHGNVQVSLIETEKLLIEMVGKHLAEMKAAGTYKGKFSGLAHFFG
jgi:pyrophosphate--fructose-6-phosphate 1-phosphotransferase